MKKKFDNNLFFTCSLIEFIGRRQKLKRNEVVSNIGDETLHRIYEYSDVFHCEPIAKVADDFIENNKIKNGDFDNVSSCKYSVPSYWDIGKVYSRLIEDIFEIKSEIKNIEKKIDIIDTLKEIYNSWISESISDYNSDFFYQPRDYIKECYIEDIILL